MPSHLSPCTHARDPQRGVVVAYVRAGSCALTRTADLYRPGSLTGSLFYARKLRNMNPTEPRPKNLPTVRPSVRELPADLLTPVGAYLRLRDLGPGFLLESVEGGQQVGRYSFLSAGCERLDLDLTGDDPFAPLRAALDANRTLDLTGLPPFASGAVGLLGYDAIPTFEPTVPLPAAEDGDLAHPASFLLTPVVVAFDHVRATVQVIAQPGHEALADEMTARLLGPLPEDAGSNREAHARSKNRHEPGPEQPLGVGDGAGNGVARLTGLTVLGHRECLGGGGLKGRFGHRWPPGNPLRFAGTTAL